MRTAPDTPENGQTVVTTTKRTVLPADSSIIERKTPDFWTYVQALTAKDWENHIVYIYRRFDTGPSQPLEKCAVYFVMLDGTKVPLANQEELEIAIAQTYGGGSYRVWIKKGSERITETRITIDGAPKNTVPGILRNAQTAPSNGQPAPTTTDVATTAMNLVANQDARAIAIATQALESAGSMVGRLAEARGHDSAPTSETDLLMKQALIEMLRKALNPPPAPDPIELVTKILNLSQSLNGGNGTAGASPIVNKILETGLERVLNPAPTGPVSSAGAELVRQLPQVAGYVTEAVREWRLGSEAQLKTAQIMASDPNRRALPSGPGAPQQPAPPASRPITQATQIAPPPGAQQPEDQPGIPSLAFIEGKIVEILKRPISVEEAADEVCSFLDLMSPTMIDQLAAATEAQLVQLFQTRPVLRQYHDLARLQEFVRAFLKYANGTDAPPEVEPSSKPN